MPPVSTIPSILANITSLSSLPRHVVVVNTLWFLSLSISLTCALLATLLQQWARRYVKITHKRHHPRNRARIRAFFAEGVDKLHLSLAVRALPALLHSSLFLFLVGLVVFLFHFNSTVFKFVAAWVGICTFLYACVTLLPIFRHDSPYNTPLSPLVWFLYTGLLCLVFQSLQWLTAFNCFHLAIWVRFRSLRDQYYGWFLHGMEKAAEEFALGLSSDIDGRALIRTLETLDEDDELEAFFEGIPGFFNSEVVSDPRVIFKTPNGEKMSEALVGFMCNTLSSNLVPELVKRRRIEICRKAVEAASLSINRRIFDRIMYKEWGGLLNSVEFGLFLRRFTYCDAFSAYYSQCVISVIVTRVQERDCRWFELAMGHLGVSKAVLREYLDHGDSLSLANCITICRHTMDAYSEHGWDRDVYSQSKTLEVLSKLNLHNTLPRLKGEFCALWNDLVKLAQSRNNEHIPISILRNIRQVFIRLHQDTIDTQDAFFTCSDNDPYLSRPLRYPFCDASSHRSNSVSCFYEAVANTTGEPVHRNILPSHLAPHHDVAFNPTLPSAGPTIQYLFPTSDDITGTSQHSIHARNCALESPAVASLVLATTTSATGYPTSNSATGTTSIPNTIHPLMETEPSPPFPIAVRGNAQPTDPPFDLPTSVPRLECNYQTHSGTTHFFPTSVNPSSFTAPQELFVSGLSVPPSATGGVHRSTRDLSPTAPTESHQDPQKTALPFSDEGSRDGGPSTERDVSSEDPTFPQKWGADQQSLSSSMP